MNTTVNITLESIIKRKISYFRSDTTPELTDMNTGYIRGYSQMLEDMEMNEAEFAEKYSEIIRKLKPSFEQVSDTDTSVDELSGYNNALVDILGLLDENFLNEL